LGATFAFPLLQAMTEAQGVAATRLGLHITHRIENLVVNPAVVVLFLAGLGLIFDDATGYRDDFPLWLGIALAWFLAAFAFSNIVQRRNLKGGLRALDGLPDSPALPESYLAWSRRMRISGMLLAASAIGILFLMAWKPGA
uniref:DUF2269 family protein n=1 Tax=Tepidiforma sp. TaxID=2682230 RepID=UPI002ADE11B8